jgi:hypothetical protein
MRKVSQRIYYQIFIYYHVLMKNRYLAFFASDFAELCGLNTFRRGLKFKLNPGDDIVIIYLYFIQASR